VTRYEFFRKRIAPVLFLGMVGLIAYDAYRTEKRTHSTIVIDLGEARPDVKQVDAELIVGGEVIGKLHKEALPGSIIGEIKFETAMPEETGTLQIEALVDGKVKTITRTIRPIEESTTTVSIGNEL
jgi:hypothetical protein